MAIKCGFFDSVDGDRKYSADDFSNSFEALIPNGVMAAPDDTMKVMAVSDFTIKVSPGWGFIERKWIYNDADLYLTIDQPDIVLERADIVVLRLNREARMMEIAVKRGTPGEAYAAPKLQRDANIYELQLAYVMVLHGRTEITQGDIGDSRNDPEVCGRIQAFAQIAELQTKITQLQSCRYDCNGRNDNIALPEFIASWSPSHPGQTLSIAGNFGVNDDTTEIESVLYSMVCQNTNDFQVTLDFSECNLITAKPRAFSYFENCHVKGLQVQYSDVVLSEKTDELNLLFGRNAVFEDCHVCGTISGDDDKAGLIRCYHLDSSRLIKCSAEFSSDNPLWGIMEYDESDISECDIEVTGTGESSVIGIDAIKSHCTGSRFKAVGYSAHAGNTGGNFTECVFDGFGEKRGCGFYVHNSLHANNCTFRGYTKNQDEGIGCGIYGALTPTVLMHGIHCPQTTAGERYYQTDSMIFAKGDGFYTGEFFTPPELPPENTILTYTDFIPDRVVTQTEYDKITPVPGTLYIMSEGAEDGT